MTGITDKVKSVLDSASYVEAGERGDLILEESGQGSCYEITVKNAPAGCIAVKTDAFMLSGFIHRKYKKRADYALVSDDEIVFVELKSGKSHGSSEVEKQIRGAQCVLAYCAAIGRYYRNDPNFIPPGLIDDAPRVLLIKEQEIVGKISIVNAKRAAARGIDFFRVLSCRHDIYYKELIS